ncbi:hypothetical protein B0H13DRAFT_1885366 [Mycena leptocephala]|nr:hypothetical protein B0H13DRAFT_1885366 [Mycena leptocephala]
MPTPVSSIRLAQHACKPLGERLDRGLGGIVGCVAAGGEKGGLVGGRYKKEREGGGGKNNEGKRERKERRGIKKERENRRRTARKKEGKEEVFPSVDRRRGESEDGQRRGKKEEEVKRGDGRRGRAGGKKGKERAACERVEGWEEVNAGVKIGRRGGDQMAKGRTERERRLVGRKSASGNRVRTRMGEVEVGAGEDKEMKCAHNAGREELKSSCVSCPHLSHLLCVQETFRSGRDRKACLQAILEMGKQGG